MKAITAEEFKGLVEKKRGPMPSRQDAREWLGMIVFEKDNSERVDELFPDRYPGFGEWDYRVVAFLYGLLA